MRSLGAEASHFLFIFFVSVLLRVSTETIRFIRDGQPRTAAFTFTQRHPSKIAKDKRKARRQAGCVTSLGLSADRQPITPRVMYRPTDRPSSSATIDTGRPQSTPRLPPLFPRIEGTREGALCGFLLVLETRSMWNYSVDPRGFRAARDLFSVPATSFWDFDLTDEDGDWS